MHLFPSVSFENQSAVSAIASNVVAGIKKNCPRAGNTRVLDGEGVRRDLHRAVQVNKPTNHGQQPCRSLLGLAERTRQPQRHIVLLSNFTLMKRWELLDACEDVFGRTLPARYLDQKTAFLQNDNIEHIRIPTCTRVGSAHACCREALPIGAVRCGQVGATQLLFAAHGTKIPDVTWSKIGGGGGG